MSRSCHEQCLPLAFSDVSGRAYFAQHIDALQPRQMDERGETTTPHSGLPHLAHGVDVCNVHEVNLAAVVARHIFCAPTLVDAHLLGPRWEHLCAARRQNLELIAVGRQLGAGVHDEERRIPANGTHG